VAPDALDSVFLETKEERRRRLKREAKKRYFLKYPEKLKLKNRKNATRDRRKSPVRGLLFGARERAKKKGIPCDITRADINVPEACPVLGIPLIRSVGKMGTDNSPSLDRVNPCIGYVRGNVVVMSHRANAIKNCGSAAEHRAVADWMERMLPARVDLGAGI
jgi:hypothetical protein